MKDLLSFLFDNKEWLFSGFGIVLVGVTINIASWTILKMKESDTQVYLHWIKNNAQWLSSGIGVFLISIIIGIASNIYVGKINQATQGNIHEKSYANQIKDLNDIEKSISNLSSFVELQKKKLRESEDILISLQQEHDTLKPIVETEREVIKKIFAIQSQMAMDNIWKERIVSFFLGILASVVASFIYALFQRFYRTPKMPNKANAADAKSRAAD